MQRNILILIASLLLGTSSVWASEITGSINTTNSLSTGIQLSLPCSPVSVANGVVSPQTCAITCNSGFNLSGQSCILPIISGGGGGGGGGGWSIISVFSTGSIIPSTNTGTTALIIPVTPPAVFPMNPPVVVPTIAVKFTDIKNHWAAEFIIKLIQRGIILNTEKFRPDDSLTRAEFLKIIGNSAGWNTASASGVTLPFTDVPNSMWYATYVRYALSANIISSSDAFRPNDPISRGEVAKILALTLGTPISEYVGVFTDVPKSYSLALYIEALKQGKIFDGQATERGLIFRPVDNITRAEIAKVVVRTFKF